MGGHRGAVRSVAFHPSDSDTLLAGGDDHSANIWNHSDDDNWTVSAALKGHQKPVRQAIFSPRGPDGVLEILTASDDGEIRVWSADGLPLEQSFTAGAPTVCVAGSADGKWIVAGAGKEVIVWNRADRHRQLLKLSGHSAEVTSIAFSPDSERLFTASQDFTIKLWDTKAWAAGTGAQREILTLEQHTDSVMSITFVGNDTLPSLLSAGADGQAILWPSVK
jgi:WD40 repeat protein